MKKQSTSFHRPQGKITKDRLDHDFTPSTVKLVNVQLVEHQADLLHLAANAIKRYSKTHSALVKMQATTSVITYAVTTKLLARGLAKQIQSAFKHYHPVIDFKMPKDETFYDVTVTFQKPKQTSSALRASSPMKEKKR